MALGLYRIGGLYIINTFNVIDSINYTNPFKPLVNSMVDIKPYQIVIKIQTNNPVEDYFSMQDALLRILQNIDINGLDSAMPIYYYVELLRNFTISDNNQIEGFLNNL